MKIKLAVAVIAILSACCPNEPRAQNQHNGKSNPSTPVTIVDNSTRQCETGGSSQKSPDTHTGVEWANWALVFVGGLTLLAVGWQAKSSANATKAMRDSVLIQEAALAQWVEVRIVGSDSDRELTDALGDMAAEATLYLRFEVRNPTSHRMRIEHVVTEAAYRTDERNRAIGEPFTTDAEKSILPPEKSYPFFVPIKIDRPLIERYLQSGFAVYINGVVYFESVSGRTDQQQWFGWEANFAHDSFSTRPFRGHEPVKLKR